MSTALSAVLSSVTTEPFYFADKVTDEVANEKRVLVRFVEAKNEQGRQVIQAQSAVFPQEIVLPDGSVGYAGALFQFKPLDEKEASKSGFDYKKDPNHQTENYLLYDAEGQAHLFQINQAGVLYEYIEPVRMISCQDEQDEKTPKIKRIPMKQMVSRRFDFGSKSWVQSSQIQKSFPRDETGLRWELEFLQKNEAFPDAKKILQFFHEREQKKQEDQKEWARWQKFRTKMKHDFLIQPEGEDFLKETLFGDASVILTNCRISPSHYQSAQDAYHDLLSMKNNFVELMGKSNSKKDLMRACWEIHDMCSRTDLNAFGPESDPFENHANYREKCQVQRFKIAMGFIEQALFVLKQHMDGVDFENINMDSPDEPEDLNLDHFLGPLRRQYLETEVLDASISHVIDTILEEKSLAPEVKIFLLEKAMTEPGFLYNFQLDALYSKNPNINLVQFFKNLNDICMDNETTGVTAMVDLFSGHQLEFFDKLAVRSLCRQKIKETISEISNSETNEEEKTDLPSDPDFENYVDGIFENSQFSKGEKINWIYKILTEGGTVFEKSIKEIESQCSQSFLSNLKHLRREVWEAKSSSRSKLSSYVIKLPNPPQLNQAESSKPLITFENFYRNEFLAQDKGGWRDCLKTLPQREKRIRSLNQDQLDYLLKMGRKDFRGINLLALSFYEKDLTGFDFRGADLSCVKFERCSFSGTNISHAKFCGVRLISTEKQGLFSDQGDIQEALSLFLRALEEDRLSVPLEPELKQAVEFLLGNPLGEMALVEIYDTQIKEKWFHNLARILEIPYHERLFLFKDRHFPSVLSEMLVGRHSRCKILFNILGLHGFFDEIDYQIGLDDGKRFKIIEMALGKNEFKKFMDDPLLYLIESAPIPFLSKHDNVIIFLKFLSERDDLFDKISTLKTFIDSQGMDRAFWDFFVEDPFYSNKKRWAVLIAKKYFPHLDHKIATRIADLILSAVPRAHYKEALFNFHQYACKYGMEYVIHGTDSDDASLLEILLEEKGHEKRFELGLKKIMMSGWVNHFDALTKSGYNFSDDEIFFLIYHTTQIEGFESMMRKIISGSKIVYDFFEIFRSQIDPSKDKILKKILMEVCQKQEKKWASYVLLAREKIFFDDEDRLKSNPQYNNPYSRNPSLNEKEKIDLAGWIFESALADDKNFFDIVENFNDYARENALLIAYKKGEIETAQKLWQGYEPSNPKCILDFCFDPKNDAFKNQLLDDFFDEGFFRRLICRTGLDFFLESKRSIEEILFVLPHLKTLKNFECLIGSPSLKDPMAILHIIHWIDEHTHDCPWAFSSEQTKADYVNQEKKDISENYYNLLGVAKDRILVLLNDKDCKNGAGEPYLETCFEKPIYTGFSFEEVLMLAVLPWCVLDMVIGFSAFDPVALLIGLAVSFALVPVAIIMSFALMMLSPLIWLVAHVVNAVVYGCKLLPLIFQDQQKLAAHEDGQAIQSFLGAPRTKKGLRAYQLFGCRTDSLSILSDPEKLAQKTKKILSPAK